ncbi:MAG: T9SS type A sorting domain-containing protein [Candidatus Kapaibacterium sp.]|jgi:hypothetical protein
MKTVIVLCIFFFLLSIPMYSQDWKIIRGSGEIKREGEESIVGFVCTNIGCYTLFSNRLMVSKDGCRTWIRYSLDISYSEYSFSDIEFFDDLHGIISVRQIHSHGKNKKYIYHTTDAGMTWNMAFVDSVSDVGIKFFRLNDHVVFARTGFLVNSGRTHDIVYKSTDKGKNWEKFIESLSCIPYFMNDSLGVLRFINPSLPVRSIRVSIVRGNSYNPNGDYNVPDILIYNTKNWKMIAQNTMYIFDEQLYIKDSIPFTSPIIGNDFSFKGWNSVRLNNGDYGHTAYGEQIYETTDGGLTWKQVFDAAPHRILPDFFYTPWGIIVKSFEDDIFIVNDTKRNPTLINTAQLDIYPNPSSSAISVTIPSVEVVIYSTLGEAIIRVQDKYENIDIQNLSTGYYIVKAVTPIGVYYNSFVKE